MTAARSTSIREPSATTFREGELRMRGTKTGRPALFVLPPGYVHPVCENCGEPVIRRDNESPLKWFERRCCSKLCAKRFAARGAMAASQARFAAAEKPCWHCRKPMARRDGEPIGKYQARATCQDQVCRTKYRQHVMAGVMKSPGVVAEVARRANVAPELESDRFAGGFATHNLRFKPAPYGRFAPPPSRTYGGVSSGWLVGGGD